ncbi:hypothetical protein [Pseudomonas sp. LB3P38]|uniref:hypothetical protein n=1 Tax=Pseudomonas lyxosi TaxID=3398358 RepID=UPI0039EFA251
MTNSSQPQAQAMYELERLTEELRANWKNERLRIEESLKHLITYDLHDDYDHIKNIITTQIKTGEKHKDQKTSQWVISESSSQITHERKNTLIAFTYLLLSEAEYRQNLIASASKLICHASYFEGYASGLVQPRINEGARGRSKNSQENQNKIAALISSHRPEGGWKKERDAANCIYEEAVKLNKSANMNLTSSHLANLMTEWMKKDGSACRAAFLGNK